MSKIRKEHSYFNNEDMKHTTVDSESQRFKKLLLTLNNVMGTQIKEMSSIISAYAESETNKLGEARFKQIKFPIEDISQLSQFDRCRKIKLFASDMTRQILTVAFRYFQQGKLTEKKMRQFFCNNFLANTIRLTQKQMRQLDIHLQENVLCFFKKKYPQSQEKSPNRKFQQIITLVDNFDSNSNDLIYQSGIQFEYKKSGDYTNQIMRFINYILNLTRQEQPEGGNLYQVFYKQMQEIFQKVESQQWMINAKNKRFSLMQQIQPYDKCIMMLGEMFESVTINKQQQKKSLHEQANKQKYKKSVKQYTKYIIGQKISDNIPIFSQKQIQEENIKVSDSGVMRILAKWCEQLQKNFEQVNINSRDERFRMADGDQRYIKKAQRKQFYLQLCSQYKKLKQFLQQVKDNIYQNQFRMLQDPKFFQSFRQFASEDEAIAGYFATNMRNSYQNYLISYLNKLIDCILSAQKRMKQRYSKKQHFKMIANLISFKVGDLLRCRCSSKQPEIIALYQYLKYISQRNKDKLQIIRVKNRLSEGTKDILINLKFHKKLLVQIQLCINQDTSNFIKCSDKANHFIYELERSNFGPISQICNVYANVDPRAQFFKKKCQEISNHELWNLSMQSTKWGQCQHKYNETTLPVWCSKCDKLNASLNSARKHKRCMKCQLSICSQCVIRNEYQNSDIEAVKFNYKQIIQGSSSVIKKKITILDLQKKKLQKQQIYLVYSNFKLMFFQYLGQKGLSYRSQATNERQFDRFFAKKQVIQCQDVEQEEQQKIIEFANVQLIKMSIKNVKKKMRKHFINQQRKTDDKVFQGQKMETVQNINMNNASLESIKNLISAFPNAKVILLHKNNISNIQGIQKWINLKQLNLQGNQLSALPPQITKLCNLEILIISNNKFNQFPNQLCQIKNLKSLNFKENKLKKLNQNIGEMKKLQVIRLSRNSITQIPPNIQGLQDLIHLDIAANSIKELPIQLKNLKNLQQIILEQNEISQIPDDMFENMQNLKKVDFTNNKIQIIPKSLKDKSKLNFIDFAYNKIKVCPEFIFNLQSLKELELSYNQIVQINLSANPAQRGTNLKSIYLQSNNLQTLPDQLFELKSLQKIKAGKPNLQITQGFTKLPNLNQLSLQNIGLKYFPPILFKLDKLETLSLDRNLIVEVPKQIRNFENTLRQLYLSHNQLKQFPRQVFILKKLQNLGLSNNPIEQIHEELSWVTTLQKLKIQNTMIHQIPEDVLNMQELRQIYITEKNYEPQYLSKLKQGYKIKFLDSSKQKSKKNRAV